MTYRYLNVLSPGPLMVIRVPTNPEPRWRAILKALTPVMQSYGLRQKDIIAIESLVDSESNRETDRMFAQSVAAAFEGGSAIPKFELYDWHDERLVLVRRSA